MDTYILKLSSKQKEAGKDGFIVWKTEKTVDNIYCDQLVDVFEQTTGFYLRF